MHFTSLYLRAFIILQVIHKDHDAAVHALASHPTQLVLVFNSLLLGLRKKKKKDFSLGDKKKQTKNVIQQWRIIFSGECSSMLGIHVHVPEASWS